MALITKLWRFHKLGSCIIKTTIKTIMFSPEVTVVTVAKSSKYKQENMVECLHIPAMVNDAIEMLQPKDHQLIVDMTFGAGGHTRKILKEAPRCRVIALDRDPVAFDLANKFASQHSQGQVIPLLGRFSELPKLLAPLGISPGSIDGIFLDVGVSSMQFDSPSRGFALSSDGPLDMRMDGNRLSNQPTAADIVNHLDEHDLRHVIKKYGEERRAERIARAIIEARYAIGKIHRTKQLAEIVANALPEPHCHDKLHRPSHVATKTFQALRIFVNNELNELSNAIDIAHRFLKVGGRCVALTFHSLEDRIVKRHFHGVEDLDEKVGKSSVDRLKSSQVVHTLAEIREYTEKKWEPISRKVVATSFEEGLKNPRARSAKLRGAVKGR